MKDMVMIMTKPNKIGRPRLNMDTKLVRVDKGVWNRVEQILPLESNPARSRLLYNTSLIKLEGKLKDKDFKDNLGRFLYGKKTWNNTKQ